MPQFKIEAVDAAGKEIKDIVEATNEGEAQQTMRQKGYHVTKIALHKDRQAKAAAKQATGKTFTLGGVPSKRLTTFTRQLSILQDAGLPILRSLNVLMTQAPPGALKNALIDVTNEIESGSSLSEAMAKAPKAFSRLYINMIKAGEAGGALETILQRLAEFLERSEILKGKIKAALTYPIAVVTVAILILTGIMIWIVPNFIEIFDGFGLELPPMTVLLVNISYITVNYWYMIPLIPFTVVMMVKLTTSFEFGRFGWHLFLLKMPVFGQIFEKSTVARTTRTLGTLVTSGVPILEALYITRETSDNAVFEQMYQRVMEAIRDGDTIAAPMKRNARPPFHLGAMLYFAFFVPGVGALLYLMKFQNKILDDMVINMVDVGEETGELDTMLYKVADVFDGEVETLTSALMSLLEPLLVVFLGCAVGFIVIALFIPLVKLIEGLS